MIQPTKTTRLYHFGLENFKQKLKKRFRKVQFKNKRTTDEQQKKRERR